MALNPPYTMEAMQCYIKYARAIKPRITQQVRVHLQREAQKGIKATLPLALCLQCSTCCRLASSRPQLPNSRSAPPNGSHLQAQRQLVLSYKRLRGDDAAPGSASAYRITVRCWGAAGERVLVWEGGRQPAHAVPQQAVVLEAACAPVTQAGQHHEAWL